MRTIIISLIAVTCIGLLGADGTQTKEQQLNKQISVLKSRNFALESENKKLKAELEKKDKAIQSLAMRLASQPARGSQKAATNNSPGYDPVEAQRKALALQQEQQKQQRARQLAIIDQKIKYHEKQKKELEKELKEAEKKVRSSQYILGKRQRQEAIRDAEQDVRSIEYKIKSTESSIVSLQMARLNYK